VRGPRRPTKLNRAKAIITAMVGKTAKRSTAVQRAVTGAGISVRTYRTARKQLGTRAIRKNRTGVGARRGRGTWYAGRGRRQR